MVIFVIHMFLSITFIYFFFREKKLGFKLPSPGDYATGILFIDTDLNKVIIYFMESKVVFWMYAYWVWIETFYIGREYFKGKQHVLQINQVPVGQFL